MPDARADERVARGARLRRASRGRVPPIGGTPAVRGAFRVLPVGHVAARFAGYGLRSRSRFDEIAGNFREEARGTRGAQAVFAVTPAIDGARKNERLPGARHS